jgi:hypothetical protein
VTAIDHVGQRATGSASRKTGSVVAAWTRATISDDGGQAGHRPADADVLQPGPEIRRQRSDPQRAEDWPAQLGAYAEDSFGSWVFP